jgi:wobble nucleotide-excising tRNase|tara:strand:+ start:61 stop:333 length:273 start_codon:yes stop_codon:yes gene_type:complete
MSKAINDSFNLTISVSFLAKILAVTAIVIGSYYQATSKMADIERAIVEMHSEITVLNSKMAEIEQEHVESLEIEIKEQRSLLQRMGLKKH